MMPTDALDTISQAFPLVKEGDPASEHDVWAGGEAKGGKPPALYLSTGLALAAFAQSAIALLKSHEAAGYRVMGEVNVDKWQVTIQQTNGAHRLAEPRWSVTAKIGIMK